MKNYLIILCQTFLLNYLWISPALAQQKMLSIEDAVLKGRTTLAPENLSQLQWIKNSTDYSYKIEKGDRQLLMRGKIETTKADTLLSLQNLNKNTGLPDSLALKSIPEIEWLNADEFIFFYRNNIYNYDVKSSKCKSLLQYDKEAENTDLETKQMNLAYTKNNNLFIASANGKILQVTHDSMPGIVNGQDVHRREFGISKGTFWSPTGNNLAFYHKDESMVTDYPLVDISTTPAHLKNIKYPMAGDTSHQVIVGIYDLSSGKSLYLKTGKPLDQYLTNISWGPQEKYIYIAVLNRDQNHMKLNQYDIKTGEFVKTLFEEKDDKYVEPLHPMLFIKGRDNEFVWYSQRDGFQQLYHYNTDGKLIKQLTKDKWDVNSILGMTEDKTHLIISGTGENPTETHIYSVDINSAKLKRQSKPAGTHMAIFNPDGNYILDNYSNMETPRIINILDLNGNTVKELLAAGNPLADYQTGITSIFTIKAEDNTPLYCRMIKPHDFDAGKKYPVLVYLYGGPHAQMVRNSWLASASLWMHYLASKGYIIFTLDNRGSGNRGLDFEQVIFRQLGDVEIRDQLKGVNYLRSLPYIDTTRLALHGWSYGGFMTTSLMLRTPGIFKVGVAGGPVIDWKYYEVMYTERYMDTPQSNPDGYEKANLLNYVKQLKGDLLLIHGTVDDVVVWQHSLSFVKKCVDEGILIDYFVYPGHKHGVRGKDKAHLMRKVLGYIEEKL
ncbi:MAG: DPP IV N-terminal domain-containing protein [Bacteroidota bacterium]